jgi:hypothetical protein
VSVVKTSSGIFPTLFQWEFAEVEEEKVDPQGATRMSARSAYFSPTAELGTLRAVTRNRLVIPGFVGDGHGFDPPHAWIWLVSSKSFQTPTSEA